MTLRDELTRRAAPLRSAGAVGRLVPAAAVALGALAVAAWLIRLGWGGAPFWVLAAWLVAMAALAIGWWQVRRVLLGLSAEGIAHRLESDGGWRRGSLTTLLGQTAAGTSPELHRLAEEREAMAVADRASAVLAPEVHRLRARSRRLVAIIAVGAAVLIAARPLDGAVGMLFRPWLAWNALSAPIGLTTDTPVVERGEVARLRISAFGQREAVLSLRAPGEPWRDQTIALDDAGQAAFETPPLEAEVVARVRAGGRSSPEVRIAMRLPAFLGAFAVTARYPEYLALEDELVPVDGDTLVVPEGTRLALSGRATTDLARVWLTSPGDTVALEVSGDRFEGEVVPDLTGTYQLGATPALGGVLEGTLPALLVRVVADSAPTVVIPVPGADTVAPPSHRIALVVAVEDDHGIVSVALELRRDGVAVTRRPLTLGQGLTDRALIATALDLDSLGLSPGDTLRYRAVASDNAPRSRVGRSAEYLVVVPTEAEERAARGEATREAGQGLDSLAALAARAQQQADELARERRRGASTDGSDPENPDPLSSEAARRAEQAIDTQEEVARELEAMRDRLDALQRAAQRGEQPDTALARQLGEIRQLLEEAMTPELREAMERLREGLQKLDASETREALSDLAERQQKMKAAIERARELFERAKSETELASLAEEARELLRRQEAATEALAADSAAGARAEEQLAARTDSLAAALDDAAERAPAEPTKEGLQAVAQEARQAASEMRAAAGSARRGQRQQAQQQAKAAGEALKPLERNIAKEREEMQEEMRAEVLEALDRLLLETSRSLAEQQVVAEALRRGALAGRLRAEQSMLEEEAAKLLQQVIAVAGKNALISPTISVALAGARDAMRQSIEATSSASPSLGLAADRAGDAVDMLAVAAYALLRSQQAVSESESGSGLEEAMQQMQQMAGEQGELSDQGKSMLQQGDPGMAEMLQMAIDQRAIAQQLERLRAEGELPGAGELAQDAKDLARSFELGRLTPETIERQQRLFRRMLDAGRSLRGEEEDDRKERESERATAVEGAAPDALDPALLRGAEFALPSWEELQRLSPDDRRRVLDYFRRLAEQRP
jgi:hypothetical protein